jgi:Mg2+-importing ATPase
MSPEGGQGVTSRTFAFVSDKGAHDVLRFLASSTEGLTDAEAKRRLERFGKNAIESKRTTSRDIFLRQLRSPLVYLLAFAATISFVLGETIDALAILGILVIDAAIGFAQEYRSEQALLKLSQHLSPRARIRRGGAVSVIDRRDVVPGDILVLEPGDIVSADVRVVEADHLLVDETALTGESIHVPKTAAAMPAPASQPYQATNVVFMMSRIVSGYGEGVVTATRAETVMGAVAALTDETTRVSGFEKNIGSMSAFLLKAVILILGCVVSANVFLKGTSEIVSQLLFAVALAVSVIPEALPAVTAITLSKGALKLAKKHVIVKRLTSIEDLGHIRVLCTDKTGTITEGILAVREVSAVDRKTALWYALAASAEDELSVIKQPKTFGAALMSFADTRVRKDIQGLKRHWFQPFEPALRRTGAVIDKPGGGRVLVSMGAAEEILARTSMTDAHKKEAAARIHEAGEKGWRVLAIAAKDVDARGEYSESDEFGMSYVGYAAFVDPLKASAKKAIHQARELEVEVKILTGDSAEVAGAVGREVGVIDDASRVMTGAQLERMKDEEFHDAVERHVVFARVSPEQKYRIIHALQRNRQVGFLGEGINDAPALKLADVSLVVESASDVAREAADIVLLRKDLHVIIEGIREGRVIFTNIIKYVKYTLTGNMGNFLAVAGISLMVDYLPMLPVQILLTNLLTDLPLLAVADDAVDAQDLRKPKTFDVRDLALATVGLGLVSSAFDFIYFAFFRHSAPAVIQTGWFIFSILTELALIYSIRTRRPFWRAIRPGRWLVGLSGLAALLVVTIPFSAWGQGAFKFANLTGNQLTTIGCLIALYFIATEAVKLFYVKIFHHRGLV